MSHTSDSEDDSVSEVESFVIDPEYEEVEDPQLEAAKFLLNNTEDPRGPVDPETQARLEALLQAAGLKGIGQLATKDGKHLADPEVLRRLTSSVSCALDEAAAALTRMRSDNPRTVSEKTSLVEACTDGDVPTVRKLLTEGRSVHETSEEGESLLSLACSAGYFELAQVLLAMHANVEDRGIKGECTPLMEAASAGHLDIVRLLVAHGADVNAQSTSGNTPLMYGCAGGHQDVVKFLLENGANVEDHNENGHTPLMEAASAGHVGLAKILLMHGAGINTHSNEFKESALTLACYKGHLDMVKFLLEAGADQEHKTDEMHTALMEASMDGHVEVARLLLDSGAQVNMPTDSFESPLTLAACGGHVDLAMLLIERGANIEEVNDEGYTPLMEAAREGHEEMVALLLSQGEHLLSQGANINAQTDETQETALTLACCGGFTEVADFLIKAGADIELGASTPLMEAAQEGHLELVKYLLENNANVHATTQTGDTALTYACENGHTDVADLLLQYGADLEHESEGGRTPLMKACRAGHLCTVQFLISKGANVRRQTQNNDHTPLSLACAGGHLPVVELLLAHRADPNHKLKDNSTMLIEAAKGGHTNVVQLLLDYPHSMLLNQQGAAQATNLSMLPGQVGSRDSPLPAALPQPVNFFTPPPNLSSNETNFVDFSPAVLQEVPEAVRIISQDEAQNQISDSTQQLSSTTSPGRLSDSSQHVSKTSRPSSSLLQKSRSTGTEYEGIEFEDQDIYSSPSKQLDLISKGGSTFIETSSSFIDYVKNRKKQINSGSTSGDEGSSQKKQQILEELHRVDREFHGKQQAQQQTQQQQAQQNLSPQSMGNHLLLSQYAAVTQEQCNTQNAVPTNIPQHTLNIDIAMQQQQGLGAGMTGSSVFPGANLQVHNAFYTGATCLQPPGVPLKLAVSETTGTFTPNQTQPAFYFTPLNTSVAVPLSTATSTNATSQPIKFQSVTSHAEVSQNTAISDRPKAKPVSKKESKNLRKQQQFQPALFGQQQQQLFSPQVAPQPSPQSQQPQQTDKQAIPQQLTISEALNQGLDLDALDQDSFVIKDEAQELTASILQQFHNSPQINSIRAAFVGSAVQSYNATLEESMIALTPDLSGQTDVSRVEYFAVPTNGTQSVQVQHALYPYEHYLQTMPSKELSGAMYQAGFQAGISMMQQQLACPSASSNETLTTTTVVPTTVAAIPGSSTQQYVPQSPPVIAAVPSPCSHGVTGNAAVQSTHHCQVPCSQHHQPMTPTQPQQSPAGLQVQAATQTQLQTPQSPAVSSGTTTTSLDTSKKQQQKQDSKKKGRLLFRHNNNQQVQQGTSFQQNQTFQIDPNSAITQYGVNQQCTTPTVPPSNYCMDVDSETESNHDTALTLACAGGHEELVELLLNRGADIEHRDKKGFTPLILAATAGHEKVVEILLNHNADIEAQSERTKDTPLSLACSGGRYEVVELLLTRNANKEHRNVSDYTPLSLAASGGYVNIIKLLLQHGAEINSRTGSKLGISPLMLAAMNGHTAAVKLLLDMGSDINAQIETNRNTALTLACFQGRHEVVSLLLDRKANVEHRAKTGLTPLMEAASGGYVEVGRVLLDKGADVNATPVPSSRDTALTIAADKGHVRFVELLLCRGASVEVKNKKGNSPLWLAANGGHLSVVELLYNLNADIDSQDNRKVSCLMAAFRKGHTKVVKWMVNHVTQFPSDQEMIRYIATLSDKELLDKCQECTSIIRAAKDTQAAKANKNASILLEELDMEKTREESKKAAAARRRERKKKKKLEKKEEKRKLNEENKKNETYDEKDDKKSDDDGEKGDDEDVQELNDVTIRNGEHQDKEEGDSGIDANSQGSCSSNDVKSNQKRKDKKKKKPTITQNSKSETSRETKTTSKVSELVPRSVEKQEGNNKNPRYNNHTARKTLLFEATRHPAEREDFEATGNETYTSSSKGKKSNNHVETEIPSIKLNSSTSPKQSEARKREEGWKEVVRKSSIQVSTTETGVKKVSVPLNAISRVIGRAGSNINAIRAATGAHIEVEKQSKGQGERIITIKGSPETTKQAHSLIGILIKDPDADILSVLPKQKAVAPPPTSLWDKTQMGTKKVAGKVSTTVQATVVTTSAQQKITVTSALNPTTSYSRFPTPLSKSRPSTTSGTTRVVLAPPRLAAQAEKNCQQTRNVTTSHSTTVITSTRGTTKVITTTATQTFAAKLTETSTAQLVVSVNQNLTTSSNKPRSSQSLGMPPLPGTGPVSPQAPQQSGNVQGSPKHLRPPPTASAPPNIANFNHTSGKLQFPASSLAQVPSGNISEHGSIISTQPRSNTPAISNQMGSTASVALQDSISEPTLSTPQEYSLFNSIPQPMWRPENESQKPVNFAAVTGGGTSQVNSQPKFMEQEPPPVVDASKAPGYRGTAVCSPVSSKTSSNSTTPPTMPQIPTPYQAYTEPKSQTMPHMGSMHSRPASQTNQNDMYSTHSFSSNDVPSSRTMQHLAHSDTNLYKGVNTSFAETNPILSMNQNEGPLLQPFMGSGSIQHLNYSQSQQQAPQPAVSMSRLNPKAPDFSSSMPHHSMPMKPPQPPIYNGYPMGNQNNSTLYAPINKPVITNFPRNAVPTNQSKQQPSWMSVPSFTPQQCEMMSGLSLQNIARVTGEMMENGGELGVANSSPAMSPSSHNMHVPPDTHAYLEDNRKPPQPIGTERTRKNYPTPDWIGASNDTKMMGNVNRWAGLDRNNYLRNQMYNDELSHLMDSPYQPPPMQMESGQHVFNGAGTVPAFFQQQMAPNMRNTHDFAATSDQLKMDPPAWDSSRPNMADHQDKQHGGGWNLPAQKWQ